MCLSRGCLGKRVLSLFSCDLAPMFVTVTEMFTSAQGATARKRLVFGAFAMFVPSLSW